MLLNRSEEKNDNRDKNQLDLEISVSDENPDIVLAENDPSEIIQEADERTVSQSPDPSLLMNPEVISTEKISTLEDEVQCILESTTKIANEVREMNKLYHNEFSSRLKSMQEELECYRERDKGRAFDEILGEIAKIYINNEAVIDVIVDVKIKKQVSYMFMDIIQILEANGVHRQKSNIGDKRNTRYCQIIERIPTDNPDLHDTISLSRSTGFYIEGRSLVKELVDIFLFIDKIDSPKEN